MNDEDWTFEERPDDLTGVPGERARRALRRFAAVDPLEPVCSHEGPRVTALCERRSWCGGCAMAEDLPRRWWAWATCMSCGRAANDEMAHGAFDLFGSLLVVTLCTECDHEFAVMSADLRQRRP